jgi:phosphoserine phosphatase
MVKIMNSSLNQYSQEIISSIDAALAKDRLINQQPVAAFDADGTLWNADLGENFFHFQIENKLVPLPENPWEHYRKWKESGDPRPAYLWLAQINEGHQLSEVRQWSENCLKKQEPLPFFTPQQNLINYLIHQGVKVFVVTASVKWAVEPGAFRLGIPEEQVLGVATKIEENGRVTSAQAGAMTYREGKTQALLTATKGQLPFLCSGNTMGDFNLLESSSGLALAVNSAGRGDELFGTEQELLQNAKMRSWLHWSFT